jgi:GNAT superfamily N-acetyltransferase
MEDDELARRAVANFGEIIAVVGEWGTGPGSVLRRPDAVGARIASVGANPWFNAAVVPYDATPPMDEPSLPYCVWTVADRVDGRIEDPTIAMPCMGLPLSGPLPFTVEQVTVGSPSLAEVGAMNDRAYGADGVFAPMATRLKDDRITTHGIRVDGRFVCAAMTLDMGDDIAVHYVATDASHRRRGLATRLLASVLERARAAGVGSATLQASPDGRSVYLAMGFREVDMLRAYVRPDVGTVIQPG